MHTHTHCIKFISYYCYDSCNYYIYIWLYIELTGNNGKENQNTNDKKRSYKKNGDKEDNEPIKIKRRRLIIPDDDSDEDIEDIEFKPGL